MEEGDEWEVEGEGGGRERFYERRKTIREYNSSIEITLKVEESPLFN